MSIAAKYRPHYTYDDYCQWEGQWELIEGMPYAMAPTPVLEHQLACGNLYLLFKQAVKEKGCKDCKVILPLDWKITDDTVVQPDLFIVCDKIKTKFLDFPPVLVVEVLSPSTASKDRGEKKELYASQNVKYYLIVDAQFKKVEIYEAVNGQYQPIAINPQTFRFELKEATPKRQRKEPTAERADGKIPSAVISMQLFKEGKSIADIAIERTLAPSTIESHLTNFVKTGEIKVDAFADETTVKLIAEYLTTNIDKQHAEIRTMLNNAYSFAQIRAVANHLMWEQEKNVVKV